eukprot:9040207-Alexandrium_andersonii.AAC.1
MPSPEDDIGGGSKGAGKGAHTALRYQCHGSYVKQPLCERVCVCANFKFAVPETLMRTDTAMIVAERDVR